jgi:hypothetical protein
LTDSVATPLRLGAAAAAAILLGLGAVLAAHATSTKQATYRGTLGGDSRVKMVVTFEDHQPRGGFVSFDRTEVLCDDQSRSVISTGPVKVQFIDRKRFVGEQYYVTPRSWEQFATLVGGKLTRQGSRIRGHFVYIEDPADPPGEDNRPECGTYRRAHWRAH